MFAPSAKIIELGGGSVPHFRPNVDVRPCYDTQGNPTVDFVADFDKPLPIKDSEWDGVFARFVIEHLSFRMVPQFLSEVFRILKNDGKVVIITANTIKQLEWLQNNPEGWDGKDAFTSASELLFGSQDYPENAHKNFLSPALITKLLADAGFINIITQPYGDRHTDMLVEATKSVIPSEHHTSEELVRTVVASSQENPTPEAKPEPTSPPKPSLGPPEELYDRAYFTGGGKVGGYAREGYWDYPVHEITAKHVLARSPQSVLEIGAARGYIGKRLEDAGVIYQGLEVSDYCCMTSVSRHVRQFNLCTSDKWPVTLGDGPYDLCFSIATLEHIPEEFIPSVIKEMARTCKSGLHGIDFGEHDDGFDKTHCSLFPRKKWLELFAKHAPNWPVEIVDKEDLEKGTFPEEVLKGDGKVKLNLGCCMTMFHHGWTNVDVLDLGGWAQQHQYHYVRADLRNGIPCKTQGADLIFLHHVLEHFSYTDGLQLLRDCRRVLKPEGVMRIVVPDAERLIERVQKPHGAGLGHFDEINEECANSSSQIGKLWALLCSGHSAAYDFQALEDALYDAGFHCREVSFRHSPGEVGKQILKETIEMSYDLSLFVDAWPRVPTLTFTKSK